MHDIYIGTCVCNMHAPFVLICIIPVRTVDDLENDETSFGPEMCHQVFGENENIFGYTDLHIRLYYSAGSLQTYLGIEYSEKVSYSLEIYEMYAYVAFRCLFM